MSCELTSDRLSVLSVSPWVLEQFLPLRRKCADGNMIYVHPLGLVKDKRTASS